MLAAAKINLALHVTGLRPNGYHLLDSLVCFADVGDIVTVRPSDQLSLTLAGPRAKDLPQGSSNIVLKAARSFGPDFGAAIHLDKRLPVAAGIGGGSADAAAALRALAVLWDAPLPDINAQLALGADVPACVVSKTLRMTGIGEQITLVPNMPKFEAVLVNPGVAVSTQDVFKALPKTNNPPLEVLPAGRSQAEWLDWMKRQRNDLEVPALRIAPVMIDCLTALHDADGCELVSMSGSGATCFGIYASARQARAAAMQIMAFHPDWWIRPTRLG
ncbi:MAG: 4-(cytidine 5'-diphospho)-2-C-methyl-D-erythritol kinase [Rhodobacterales bacterium]